MKCMEKAYAKVNLTLQVGSRRPDGYHAVMSVMQRISLWDTVTVERGTGRDTLLCSVAGDGERRRQSVHEGSTSVFCRNGDEKATA